jgi:peptidylprolyl isomerase
MRRRFLLAAVPLLAAGVVAGCGSDNSDTANIQPPPSQSQTLTFTATSTSSTGATGPTIVTPSHGKLSVKPTITAPKTAPPKSLVTKDLITGTGAAAQPGDTITVNYVGALYNNGKVFDASWNRNQPLSTPLGEGGLIKGWDQGLVGMRVGGRRELIIPPSLAYGKSGQGPIPGNSTLIFVVDLLGLTPPNGSTASGATVATGALGSTGGTGSTGSTGATG